MIIVTDLLWGNIDEGAKKSTLCLIRELKTLASCFVISLNGTLRSSIVDKEFSSNKLLFNFNLLKFIKNKSNDDIVLYIPESSLTYATIFRSKILNFFTQKKIYVIAFQPRKFNTFFKYVLQFVKPSCVFVQSLEYSKYLTGMNFKNFVIPLGVDLEIFKPVSLSERKILRKKYEITENSKIVLHVGHIQHERNLEWLVSVKENFPELSVVVVGSTYSDGEDDLYHYLISNGVTVFKEYIADIHELYQLSDYYIFPVKNDQAAIGTPLSVLEAMACDNIILTTKFGSLIDNFKSNDGFCFVNDKEQLIESLSSFLSSNINYNNVQRVQQFSWSKIANLIIKHLK